MPTTSKSIVDMTRGVYRRMYAGFLDGKRINSVSIQAEAWFWRLNALADDFGNLKASPRRVAHDASPKRLIGIPRSNGWVRELVDAKLIEHYEVDGECFIHIKNFTDLQPAGRNGKRIQKCKRPGESGCIQVNPEKSGCVVRPDNDTDTHTDTHTDTEAGESKQSNPGGGLSSSLSPDRISRVRAQMTFYEAVEPLFGRDGSTRHPKASPQWTGDQTCAKRWFDDLFPDEGQGVLVKRLTETIGLFDRARRAKRPMAWLTTRLKGAGA